MAKIAIKKASTDVTVYLFIQDSSVTTGAGKTGLAYNTENLVASYVRPLAARAALSLATQTVTGAHSDGGFVEVDATNMPGVYRLDLSDAVCATGVNSVVVMLKGAANMAPVLLEIQLTDFDLNSTSNAVGAAASVTNGVNLATDAVSAAAVSTGAVTKVQAGLALEATLTAIKGIDWTDETLKALMTAIEAISVSGASAAEVWAYAQRYLSGQTDGLMVIGPVRNDGKIDAVAGDDYYTADGRGMQWSDTAWPNLTGATVSFISGSTTIAMTVVTSGSGEQTVNLDVPRATSLAMKGEFKFIIRATLASTAHVVTLLEGEGKFE